MIKDQDHYKVLGVTPSASVEQIRAAYVYLLKRFHPDSSPGEETGSTGVYVQRVVAAYNTLKDPRRRAVYDAELRRSAQTGASQKQRRRSASRNKRRRGKISLDPNLLFYVLIFAAAVVGIQLLISGLTRLQREQSRHAEVKELERQSPQNLPTPAGLEPVAKLAGLMAAPAAKDYSVRCFAQARRQKDAGAADRCVAFDTAFVYWRQTVAGAYIADPYFQLEAMSERNARAFAKLDPDQAVVRVASIRATTFEALLRVASAPDELSIPMLNQTDSQLTEAPSEPPAGNSAAADH